MSSNTKALPKKLSRRRKLIYASITFLLFFTLVEATLTIIGYRSAQRLADPYVSFTGTRPLFVRQAEPRDRVVLATAPERLVYFNWQEFDKKKMPDTFRVFCLGGSTTYGRPYDDATSYCSWLRELLPRAAPDQKYEVINVGGISYASYRLAVLLEEVLRYEPDLIILQTGHNEFLERRTYRDVYALPSPVRQTIAVAGKTRTWQAMSDVVHAFSSRKNEMPEHALPLEVDAILDQTTGPQEYVRDDEYQRQVVSHLSANLVRMIKLAGDRDVPMLIVAPGSNLANCRPFKSVSQLSGKAQEQWQKKLDDAEELVSLGQVEQAMTLYEQALELDSRHPLTHYQLGRLQQATGDDAAARRSFVIARDEDVCSLRATSEIMETIRAIADHSNTPLVDMEALLGPLPGKEQFFDHVHPRVEMHGKIATAIIQRLADEEWLSTKEGWQQESWPEVHDDVVGSIDPQRRAVGLRNLAKVLAWSGKWEEAGPPAIEALKQTSDDTDCLLIAGKYCQRRGEYQQAVDYLTRFVELRPGVERGKQALENAMRALASKYQPDA